MLKQNYFLKTFATSMFVAVFVLVGGLAVLHSPASAARGDTCTATDAEGNTYGGTQTDKGECIYVKTNDPNLGSKPGDPGVNYCGDKNKNAVVTSINFGCKGKGNAILDMTFAVIRFLTLGVSLVIIASMVVAGLQFTASRGDPQATAASLKRMASNASALLLFIFAYAILNWIVPNTLLQ